MPTNNDISEHMKGFVKCLKKKPTKDEDDNQAQWRGHDVLKWWEWVKKNGQLSDFKSELLSNYSQPKITHPTREDLKKICAQNSGCEDWECLAAVMAWDGQNRKHGVSVFKKFESIKDIIHEMRKGDLSHECAYKKFYEVWLKNGILGMGAAYFTKLIFFCEPSHKGYIMDQWTSKSVNLLPMGEDSLFHRVMNR